MFKKSVRIPKEIYNEKLKNIHDIEFTAREVDVLACLLVYREGKRIPATLSMAPKTLSSHLKHIRAKIRKKPIEAILCFLETSKQANDLKTEHYPRLLLLNFFEKQLRKIPKIHGEHPSRCIMLFEHEQRKTYAFIDTFEEHLKLVGFPAKLEPLKPFQTLGDIEEKIDVKNYDFVFALTPETFIEKATISPDLTSSFRTVITELQNDKHTTKLIYIVPEGDINMDCFRTLIKQDLKDLPPAQNYYLAFLTLLESIRPHPKLEPLKHEFVTFCEETLSHEVTEAEEIETPSPPMIIEHKRRSFLNLYVLGGIFSVFVIGGLFFAYSYFPPFSYSSIRSSEVLPPEAILYDRTHLLTLIEKKFNKSKPIQSLAIIGIGGSGKTTLARTFAKQENVKLIWELNAESQDTIKSTFEDLGEAISDKDNLEFKQIKSIKNAAEKDKRMLHFVQGKLKSIGEWLIVFDNIDKFDLVKNYFPHDPSVWGKGRVILTSRNGTLENNSHIDEIINISELNDEQKNNLFIQIITQGNEKKLTLAQREEIQKFLQEIPPYPLDVSVAAYYIKSTQLPLLKYLERIKNQNKEFLSLQKNITQEMSDYPHNRYQIVSISVDSILQAQEDFAQLLVLLSLIDSQNIPRSLLQAIKSDLVVDNIIHNLKKYSFAAQQSAYPSEYALSFHRTIQAIIQSYLWNKLDLETNPQLVNRTLQAVNQYISDIITKDDLEEMKVILPHIKAMYNHPKIQNDSLHADLGLGLAVMDRRVKFEIEKSRSVLEKSLAVFEKQSPQPLFKIAQTKSQLALIAAELGDLPKGIQLLNQCISDYTKHFGIDHHKEMTCAFLHLGLLYMECGDYEKAEALLQKAFSINKNDSNGSVFVASNQGLLYRVKGQYTKAKEVLEKCLAFQKKHFGDKHLSVAMISYNLGVVYKNLGHYDKAKEYLENSLAIYNASPHEEYYNVKLNSIHLAKVYGLLGDWKRAKISIEETLAKDKEGGNWLVKAFGNAQLGIVYRELGDLTKSKELLEGLLHVANSHFGEESIQSAWLHYNLGKTLLQQKDLAKAHMHLEKSLHIYKMNNHSKTPMVLEILAEARQPHSPDESIALLKQGIEFAKSHFSTDSPHIRRLQAKIDRVKSSS